MQHSSQNLMQLCTISTGWSGWEQSKVYCKIFFWAFEAALDKVLSKMKCVSLI